MTQSCGYAGNRDEALVTYLYDDASGGTERSAFKAHLAGCIRCTEDLAALRGVRTRLGHWNPPGFASITSHHPPAVSRRWWQEIPAWAQVAAALLFLGVSAAIANVDARYDANGLSVRTGWSNARDGGRAASGQAATSAPAALVAPVGTAPQANVQATDAPWRADLAALERQLKTELRGVQSTAAAPRSPGTDAELLRRVRALVEESAKRQQSELALRLAEAIHDVNGQRQADLVRMQNAIDTVQNRLGVQVLRNSHQVQQMDYLIRTSQRQ